MQDSKEGESKVHWHRLVTNFGGKPKDRGRQRVVIADESIGVSQLLGAHDRATPQTLYVC